MGFMKHFYFVSILSGFWICLFFTCSILIMCGPITCCIVVLSDSVLIPYKLEK